MSRSRFVKGTYTKISGKGHSMFSKEHIITTAGIQVREEGVENGIFLKSPEAPPETPMLGAEKPELKGEIIFCNGYNSGAFGGATNAIFDYTVGTEEKPWYGSDGDNAHHENHEINTDGTITPVQPGHLDDDMMDADEVNKAEKMPEKETSIGIGVSPFPPYIIPKSKIKDTPYKTELTKFKGYWNDYRNFSEAIDLYTTFFNAEKRDHYINGSHGMGSPAWERECHGITQGYYWAVKHWKLKTKDEVEKEKEKNPNAESYSPAYRPLTFVGHSEGCAVAVGACLGAMYYAAEKGWDEVAVNLVLLGVHQPVRLWSDEPYNANRKQVGDYQTDYNTYKWFKTEVLEVGGDSPRMYQEIINKAMEIESALTPFSPATAHIFTSDRNKQRYGIDEWTNKIIGTDSWNILKKRAVQFTFSNDKGDTVMIDGDIPGIANARSNEDNTYILGWRKWYNESVGTGGLSPNSDFSIKVDNFGVGSMNTRIQVSKTNNPEFKATYRKTTYESWVNEFFQYHKVFKQSAFAYEKKYKEAWTTGEVYLKDNLILTNANKALEYAKVADNHTDMMARYVWMHHIELEAHFAPVGFLNRPEIFNLKDGKRNPLWPEDEGKTIWHRILKTSEKKGDIFYRVSYLENNIYYEDLKKEIIPKLVEKKKDFKFLRDKEDEYVKGIGENNLINPKIAYTSEVEKWVNVAKEVIEEQYQKDKEQQKIMQDKKKQLQKIIQDNIEELRDIIEENNKKIEEERKQNDVEWGD